LKIFFPENDFLRENHVVINGGATYFMDPIAFGFSDRDTPAMKEGMSKLIFDLLFFKENIWQLERKSRYDLLKARVDGTSRMPQRSLNVCSFFILPMKFDLLAKKTPFHEQQPLIEKLQSMTRMGPGGRVNNYDMETIRRGVKGMH
jgi:hypothetical protein